MSSPSGGQHAAPDLSTSGPLGSEPVLLSHLITTVLLVAAGAGWLTIPNPLIDAIATAAAVLLSSAGAFAARAKVSPSGRITWEGITSELQSMLYDELDHILASAPAGSPELAAAQLAEAIDPALAARPQPAQPQPAQPQPEPQQPASAQPAWQPTFVPPNPAPVQQQVPVGQFTTSAPFGPPPTDPAPTAIQPAVPPATP